MNPAEFQTLASAEIDLWWYRGMRRILYVLLDPVAAGRRGGLVLDAGAGTGYMAALLRTRYRWRVIAVDRAWQGLSARPAPERVPTAQANIAACPFADGQFDGLLSLDVLVYFEPGEHLGALREFARVLRPGGFLAIRVAALDILYSRHSLFTGERQRFTRRGLIDSVRAAGFNVVRCTYANSFLAPVALFRFRIWEPLLRQPPASGTGLVAPWLNRLLELPLRLEAFFVSIGWNFPVGQSLVLIAEKDTESRD